MGWGFLAGLLAAFLGWQLLRWLALRRYGAEVSARRHLTAALWDAPREGNILVRMELDLAPFLAWQESFRASSGVHVTLTHAVGRAFALGIASAEHAKLGVSMDRLIAYPSIDLAFLVEREGGRDVGFVTLREVDKKPLTQIAQELAAGSGDVRQRRVGTTSIVRWLPTPVLRHTLRLLGGLAGAGLRVPLFEPFPFGMGVITSLSPYGIDEAFAPRTPFSNVTFNIAIGQMRERVTLVDGVASSQPFVTLCLNLDHRAGDALVFGQVSEVVRSIFADPERLA